jgi:hypothetical protein
MPSLRSRPWRRDPSKLASGEAGAVQQVLGGALDEGRAHVDADLGDLGHIAAMLLQVSGEGADRGGILAVGHEQHLPAIEVDEERDVVVAAA